MSAPKKRTKISTQLGAVVRHSREGAALSQESLAERADLSKNYVGSIERGEQDMRVSVLVKLALALGKNPSELLRECGY
jgi:transcriptional regulator with XRE-family HTH domain